MPKRIRKTRKYKRKNNRKNNRKSRRKILKAGNGDRVKCSMCEKMVNKDDTMAPSACLLKHKKAAHRICQDCWWDPDTGFGKENASHKCPGCVKGLPLTPYKKEPDVIDLTED